jgi:hypothetical protein
MAFAVLHAGAVFGKGPGTCNCFGSLGLKLNAEVGLLVDIVLVFPLLVILRGVDQGEEERWHAKVLPFILPPLAALLLWHPPAEKERWNDLGSLVHRTGIEESRALVILLRPEDLQCALCFDDLLALSDSLAAPGSLRSAGPLIMLPDEGSDSWTDPGRAERWVKETGFQGPVILIEPRQFDAIAGGRSQAVVIEKDGRIRMRREFPMGPSSRKELLMLLAER